MTSSTVFMLSTPHHPACVCWIELFDFFDSTFIFRLQGCSRLHLSLYHDWTCQHFGCLIIILTAAPNFAHFFFAELRMNLKNSQICQLQTICYESKWFRIRDEQTNKWKSTYWSNHTQYTDTWIAYHLSFDSENR